MCCCAGTAARELFPTHLAEAQLMCKEDAGFPVQYIFDLHVTGGTSSAGGSSERRDVLLSSVFL